MDQIGPAGERTALLARQYDRLGPVMIDPTHCGQLLAAATVGIHRLQHLRHHRGLRLLTGRSPGGYPGQALRMFGIGRSLGACLHLGTTRVFQPRHRRLHLLPGLPVDTAVTAVDPVAISLCLVDGLLVWQRLSVASLLVRLAGGAITPHPASSSAYTTAAMRNFFVWQTNHPIVQFPILSPVHSIGIHAVR